MDPRRKVRFKRYFDHNNMFMMTPFCVSQNVNLADGTLEPSLLGLVARACRDKVALSKVIGSYSFRSYSYDIKGHPKEYCCASACSPI